MSNITSPVDFLNSYIRSGTDYQIDIDLTRDLPEPLFRNYISQLNTQFVVPARIAFVAYQTPSGVHFAYAQYTQGLFYTQKVVIDKILLIFSNYFPSVDWGTSEGETDEDPIIPEEGKKEPLPTDVSWWDSFKEYFTVICAQGFWWFKKAPSIKGWFEENKTSLLIVAGIIIIIVVLVYSRPYVILAGKVVKKK